MWAGGLPADAARYRTCWTRRPPRNRSCDMFQKLVDLFCGGGDGVSRVVVVDGDDGRGVVMVGDAG